MAGYPPKPLVGTTSWRVRRVAETGSTNTDLVAAARAGEPAGAVLVTDHQTAGRGRLGRSWQEAPGSSLLVSILLRPDLAPSRLHRVTQAVAVAAAMGCEEVAGVSPVLKWPNDLLVGGEKLAGILAESVLEPPGTLSAVVVGMGLNLRAPAADVAPDVAPEDRPARRASLEVAAGRPVERDTLLGALLRILATIDDAGLDAAYRARLGTLGQAVSVHLADRVLTGVAVDVDPDGALVVETPTGRESVIAGDVIHLR